MLRVSSGDVDLNRAPCSDGRAVLGEATPTLIHLLAEGAARDLAVIEILDGGAVARLPERSSNKLMLAVESGDIGASP